MLTDSLVASSAAMAGLGAGICCAVLESEPCRTDNWRKRQRLFVIYGEHMRIQCVVPMIVARCVLESLTIASVACMWSTVGPHTVSMRVLQFDGHRRRIVH